ncbi:hypothetical protein Ait01nite_083290 [Actinoplanes italicus]|uniref:LPXTG-motif cell wall-anchored protein n=1 Tax=Actinoplanes italicus TaxID=113567 RepID=A0A2T0JXP7_9ACTN|nr:hypothetical protein [Actinoplanes italicus]PRX12943.1 hypothetical protein CLV67_12668 [Actinoplanes italicus]GIE35284.1 hypothetical protein Ait01nite_083290 [Actinoplanes italicus]
MRLRALISRFALTVAVSGLAAGGLALPAHAESEVGDFAYVGILSPETVTVINGQSKTVKFDLYNLSTVTAERVVLHFGSTAKPISADLGFTAPAGCDETSCVIGDLKPGQRRGVKFTVKPTALDPAKSIVLSTSVGGQASDETSIAVVGTDKAGADIEVDDIADLKLSAGGSAEVPVRIRNSGNKDVTALGLVVAAPAGLTPALNYSNCEQDPDLGGFVCVFNDTLAAGGVFSLPENTPLRIKVPAGVAGPYDYPVLVAAVGLTDKYVFDFAKRTAGASGRELKLESAASISAKEPDAVDDLNEDDNFSEFTVSVPKTAADSAAVGGVFKGEAGDDRTVKVGVHNLGPSGTIPPGLAWIQYAHVKLPTGVLLTTVDMRCIPGTSPTDIDETVTDLSEVTDLICIVLESVPDDGRYLFTLSAEIQDAEHKAGSVTVDGGVQDAKRGNNRAALTVETTGGTGGGLPITGAPAGMVAGGGVVLLAAGLIAFRLARRRRIVTVVE